MPLNAFASVLVCWGYQMSFGHKMTRFLGRPDIYLDQKCLLGQAFLGYLPNAPMVYFQIVFTAITLILVAGKDEFSCMDAVCAAVAYLLLHYYCLLYMVSTWLAS